MRRLFSISLMLIVISAHSQQVSRIPARQQTDKSNYTDAKVNGLECDIVTSFPTEPYACYGLDNEGNFLWLSLSGYYDYIFKFDTLGNKVDSVSVPFFGAGASYADIEVSGNILWIVNESSSKLIKVNLTNGNIVLNTDLPDAGFDPNYFSVAFDGQSLWVLNYQTSTDVARLYKMDTATHEVLDSIDLAHKIITIEMIGNEMWGTCINDCNPLKLFRINTSNGAFTDSSEWCVTASPYGMAWDGNSLWQSEGFDHQIRKIDIGFNSAILPTASIPEPVLVAFPNPAGSTVMFSSAAMKGILVIRNCCGIEMDRFEINHKNITLSLDRYPAGIYMAHLDDEEKRISASTLFAVQ